jgi:hypothetical protein
MANQDSTPSNAVSQEVWLPVPDFPGYDVSNQGRVRSYWRKVSLGYKKGTKQVLDAVPQRIRKPGFTKFGYPQLRLYQDKRFFAVLMHRLVLSVFVGPCPPGMEACHNDGVPVNCTVDNLRWDTKSNNHFDRRKHGTISKNLRGERNPFNKLTETQVMKIRDMHGHGTPQKKLSNIFNVAPHSISVIVNRKTWRHLSLPSCQLQGRYF